ncbi:MAG TPA: hypothetical protein VMW89_07910 [Desulfatiglandales bacterium]|nr:hypothetical protein [Desulfatiglandales bacterium]
MGLSFFAQCPQNKALYRAVTNRRTARYSPSTKVKACVRRLETPTSLSYERPALARDYGNIIVF